MHTYSEEIHVHNVHVVHYKYNNLIDSGIDVHVNVEI